MSFLDTRYRFAYGHHMPRLSVTDTSVTYDEAAAILRVSRRTVHRVVADGKLTPVVTTSIRGRRTVRFHRTEVEALALSAAS